MKLFIQCPLCRTSLGKVSQNETSRVFCASCKKGYKVLYGKLSGRSSVAETVLYFTSKLPKVHKRHYELRITTPARQLKVLRFSMAGRTDVVPVRQGDLVSILYNNAPGDVLGKLVGFNNHTTGHSYALPSPICGLTPLIATRGAFLGIMLLSLLAFQVNPLAITALFSVVSYIWWKLTPCAQLTHPPLQAQVQEEARLMLDQQLFEQKGEIERRVEDLRQEYHSNQGLINRLETLKQRMVAFNETLYAPRINRLDRAIAVLKQQSQNVRRLVGQYQHLLEMITIEVETTNITDQLPEAEDFTKTILTRLQELQDAEEQNQNFRYQVEANEEVRQLSQA